MQKPWRTAGVCLATYMQMFFVAIGRLLKELTKPYIYLVPEPPMKKLALQPD